MTMMAKRSKMEVVDDDKPRYRLRCECGHEFLVNVDLGTNMIAIGRAGKNVVKAAKCPMCGRVSQ